MKLEELAREAIAEENYKVHLEEYIVNSHVLESENLDITVFQTIRGVFLWAWGKKTSRRTTQS
jgi:hypothetical protein